MNPVIPCLDLSESLTFWVDCLGFQVVDEIHQGDKTVWCMLSGFGFYIQLNHRQGTDKAPDDYEGIRMYWEPEDLEKLHQKLDQSGFNPTEIVDREYGRREFSLTDRDNFQHCFGVEIK